MSRFGFSLVAALALISAPVAAQDEMPSEADWTAMTADLGMQFPVVPLSAEEQARLPQARALIERVMPEGAIQEMMGGMFGGMLGPMMQADANDAAEVISARFGYNMTASAEDASEAAAILDPSWGERRRREAELLPVVMNRAMTVFEPFMRNAMAELYAVHFTAEELSGIDTFFATPIGAAYAKKSFNMTSDPRLMGSVMHAMPQLMGSFASLEQDIAAATADLPPERSFADLNGAERQRLAELIGLPAEDLEYYLDADQTVTVDLDQEDGTFIEQ